MCKGDLKQRTLEERIYRTYWGDGSLDLFIGMVVMGIGMGWMLGVVFASAILPVVAIPLWIGVRRTLIEPRMGAVTFSEQRRRKERRGMGLLVAAGSVALVVVIAGLLSGKDVLNESISSLLAPGFPAMLIGLAGLLSGWMFQISRLTAYGLAGLIIGLMGAVVTPFEPPILIVSTGVLPMCVGAILLVRFLGQYPKPDREEDQSEGL